MWKKNWAPLCLDKSTGKGREGWQRGDAGRRRTAEGPPCRLCSWSRSRPPGHSWRSPALPDRLPPWLPRPEPRGLRPDLRKLSIIQSKKLCVMKVFLPRDSAEFKYSVLPQPCLQINSIYVWWRGGGEGGHGNQYCAAEAIFCCTTENSHHLEA